MSAYTHVIWDWNGTLLDDLDVCVACINRMLSDRGLKTLEGREGYRDIFNFPVVDFYRSVGFDFDRESFEMLAHEYIESYERDSVFVCGLHKSARETLRTLADAGLRQVILSATEQPALLTQIERHGLTPYFSEIIGQTDSYAHGKLEAGRAFRERAGAAHAVMIGDTTHDWAVSVALGMDCLLVSNGHQSDEVLRMCGVPVLDRLEAVLPYILENWKEGQS